MAKSIPVPHHHWFFIPLLSFTVIISSLIILSRHLQPFGPFTGDQSPVWKDFISADSTFSFQYPPEWILYESPNEISLSQPDSPYGFTFITIKNMSRPEKYLDDLEKTQNFAVATDSAIRIGNLNTLTLTDSTPTHDQYMLYHLKDNLLITVVFLSDTSERTELVKRILSTFRLLPSPAIP